tara:strand:- start:763 stop:933 length:171 start_codon:yes stop_codon:yes gene_type:complete
MAARSRDECLCIVTAHRPGVKQRSASRQSVLLALLVMIWIMAPHAVSVLRWHAVGA